MTRTIAGAGVVALLAWPAAATAQLPAVSIGDVSTAQQCQTYLLTTGRAAMSANAYGMAASASWRQSLERDCVSQFETLRASLASALAASGRVRLAPRGARGSFVLSATVGAPGTQTAETSGADLAASHERSAVTMTLLLRDPAGRVVDGGLMQQAAETASSTSTDAFTTAATQDGEAAYAALEQGLAAAAARRVAFRIAPLRVSGTGSDGVQLDAGAPLLATGMAVQLQGRDGRFARYRIVAAAPGNAVAEPDGDEADVPVGSLATVIEAGDPAANARTIRRVGLP